MKKKDLEKFKRLLLLERQQIMDHLSTLEGASEKELANNGGDSVDLASIEIAQASIQKLGNREKNLLKKIAHALEKVESGEYGVCEECGCDISLGRLEARPVAQYCIDCKNELEQAEKRYGDPESGSEEESWSLDENGGS